MTQSMRYILVTGTNGGLGLGICTRLLDDFLHTQPQTSSLTLIFTTRSTRKGNETLQILKSYLSTHHSTEAQSRIHLQPENVELTTLLNVRALSRKLLRSNIPYLNAVILNAGIGGWSGLDWPRAVRDVTLHMPSATTWPKFKLGIAGLITDRQIPSHPETEQDTPADRKSKDTEPPLGQVFCANIFGHYMLVHWLMPLLRACDPSQPARIIWVGSIEPTKRHFSEDDLMGLRTTVAYESSKRLTDLLALTSTTSTARRSYQDFITVEDSATQRQVLSEPAMYVAHPGICATSIVALYWILQQCFVAAVFIARWLGGPWSNASTYLAAMSLTWLAIAPVEEIDTKEGQVAGVDTQGGSVGGRGMVKWGTAVTRLGTPSVRPTEVEGWGIIGDGAGYVSTWWAGAWGRAPGAVEAKKEDVDEFVATGGRVWAEMERLRLEWEALIKDVEGA